MQMYVYIPEQLIISMVDDSILCKENSDVIMKGARE